MEDMTSYVTMMSDGLDSIAHQENILLNNKGNEGIYIDRNQLKHNLDHFADILSLQKQRLEQMEDSLKVRGAEMQKLRNLISVMRQQLNEKDQQIASLRSDLEKKNVSIAQLQSRVKSLTETNTKMGERMEKQLRVIATQDNMINECYVKIGTKDELRELGVITSGFAKKARVDYQKLQKSKFMRVDIRHFTEIPLNSKKPKVLTPMPASSYKMISNANGTTTLRIVDPTLFWSVSNYLIILTN
ncbi:MAG: hypothetical protein IJ190_07840 [Prevotella sp.]|nr:hypothetical protein [Prevotella sp.]